jgi:MoaA/NifB/PqqE/SkfB family radical SAM enzyme
MGLLESGFINLVSATINRDAPLYVQYYTTARCNLRCEQCNVIYANADRRELQTHEAKKVIENLATIGTQVLLFTGGEPFVRSDMPQLAGYAKELGIHPRIQTNGLATRQKLIECAQLGVRDISISLDSLNPDLQDSLNGGFESSWDTAIRTIANVGEVFGAQTFAAFGCVFSPFNFHEVPNIIKFATEIGWWVSLVPAHTTLQDNPRSFSTFNQNMLFPQDSLEAALLVLEEVKEMKRNGFNVYDSDQFLDDIERFIQNKPITWRGRNGNVCDAGTLYFAVLPDGALAPCCDWRLDRVVKVHSDSFVEDYKNREFQNEIYATAKACSGCLYGSYPEISISARFAKASLERFQLFFKESNNQISILSESELKSIAQKIRSTS